MYTFIYKQFQTPMYIETIAYNNTMTNSSGCMEYKNYYKIFNEEQNYCTKMYINYTGRTHNQSDCDLYITLSLFLSGFHTGGGPLGSPPPPPPPTIPKVVTVLLINRYIVGTATGQTILKSTVKYIKVQLDYSKVRRFFSLSFLPIALKLGVVYDIVGVS